MFLMEEHIGQSGGYLASALAILHESDCAN